MKKTPLYEYHAANGRLAEFAGYEMPIWYTSIVEEHLAVRRQAGIFDVSHMGRLMVSGPDAGEFVSRLVPTNSLSQPNGKSFYTLLLNEQAGIVDDIIIIKRSEQDYMLVVNASNRAKDLDHMRRALKDFDAAIDDITESSTMIAVQGPESIRALQPVSQANLSSVKRFTHISSKVGGSRATVTRTGYTGEDGFEVILHDSGLDNNSIALAIWNELAKRAKPCALGARDSLRIEAGLPLYGSDIGETTNPFEAELSWVVSKDKQDYIGRDAISVQMSTTLRRVRRGVILGDGIPRNGFEIAEGARRVGEITSGTFSPILRKGIGLGYVETGFSSVGQSVSIDVRGLQVEGKITKPPFYDEHQYGWKRNPTKSI